MSGDDKREFVELDRLAEEYLSKEVLKAVEGLEEIEGMVVIGRKKVLLVLTLTKVPIFRLVLGLAALFALVRTIF